jgi:hypothetical protein
MADFLNSLLLRSTGESSATAILQPRLPSLFEPLQGMENNITPPPDLIEQENLQSPDEPSVTVFPTLEPPNLTGKPSQQRTRQSIDPSIQPMKTVPHTEKPQRTILPRNENEILSETKPKMKMDNNSREEEHESNLHTGISPKTKLVSENQNHVGSAKETLQAKSITVLASSHIETEPHRDIEPHPVPIELKPKSVLQPISVSSHLPKTYQLEQTQRNESERTVEIHIGRIEVRAMPAPAPIKRQTPQASAMSLEEYLKSRSGDRR